MDTFLDIVHRYAQTLKRQRSPLVPPRSSVVGFVNACQILTTEHIFRKIAKTLNDAEGHRSDTAYENVPNRLIALFPRSRVRKSLWNGRSVVTVGLRHPAERRPAPAPGDEASEVTPGPVAGIHEALEPHRM